MNIRDVCLSTPDLLHETPRHAGSGRLPEPQPVRQQPSGSTRVLYVGLLYMHPIGDKVSIGQLGHFAIILASFPNRHVRGGQPRSQRRGVHGVLLGGRYRRFLQDNNAFLMASRGDLRVCCGLGAASFSACTVPLFRKNPHCCSPAAQACGLRPAAAAAARLR